MQEKKKKICDLQSTQKRKPRHSITGIPIPTDQEIQETYRRLSEEKCRPVILSIVPGYAKLYAPPRVPKPLKHLFNKGLKGKSLNDIKVI